MTNDTARTKEFEDIVQRYQRRLVSMACRILGNIEEAGDVAQEAFIRLWQRGTKSSDERSVFGFLARTVTNLCIDELRRRQRFRFFSLGSGPGNMELPSSTGDPEHRASKHEMIQIVLRAAERLKPKQKAVFVLRDIEGFSVKEASEIVGCSENNVLATLFHARKNLRKWLGPILHRSHD
jgi:RNA polymerase sigma-70 factor (ECF subfamily)